MNRPGYDLNRTVVIDVPTFKRLAHDMEGEGYTRIDIAVVVGACQAITVDATGEKLVLSPQRWV